MNIYIEKQNVVQQHAYEEIQEPANFLSRQEVKPLLDVLTQPGLWRSSRRLWFSGTNAIHCFRCGSTEDCEGFPMKVAVISTWSTNSPY